MNQLKPITVTSQYVCIGCVKGAWELNVLVAFFPMLPSLLPRVIHPPPAWETLCLEVDQAAGSYRRSGCVSGITLPPFSSACYYICSAAVLDFGPDGNMFTLIRFYPYTLPSVWKKSW